MTAEREAMTLEQVRDELRYMSRSCAATATKKDVLIRPARQEELARRLLKCAGAIDAHLSRAAEPVAKGVNRYPISAQIYQRRDEWVLELSGLINDCSFTSRHTEPLTTSVEDVAGLPSLYTYPPEPARDAKDAARFHWLLENCSSNGGLGVEIFIGDEAPDAEDLIERIDAAMAHELGDATGDES